EREDLGFGRVQISRRVPGNPVSESDVVRFFHNHNYYMKGLLAAEYERDANARLMTGVRNIYEQPPANPADRHFFPHTQDHYTLFYEGVVSSEAAQMAPGNPTGSARKFKKESFTFDDRGNVTKLVDTGDEQSDGDDVQYDVDDFFHDATLGITKA